MSNTQYMVTKMVQAENDSGSIAIFDQGELLTFVKGTDNKGIILITAEGDEYHFDIHQQNNLRKL